MSYKIRHRLTGRVLRYGEGDLRDADLHGADLQGANLRGADLWGIDLRSAHLWDADLRDAFLRDADLREADLRQADLREAYLEDACLWGANLRATCVLDIGQRSDGDQFFLHKCDDGEPFVLSGHRYIRMPEARTLWEVMRGGTPLGDETLAMLDHGENLLKIRGLT